MDPLGYALTAGVYGSFVLMLVFLFLERKGVAGLLRQRLDRRSIAVMLAAVIFFAVFSLLWVTPTEQLYFDENIYQGIAMNILHSGNAQWCQYGTGYVSSCYLNEIYHDPIGWSAFMAIAFALFGTGFGTAYNLQLFSGVLSIVAMFLASSILLNRKSFAMLSTWTLALTPILFIWARTQADVDLPFMMFATFSFFFFLVFAKRKNAGSLGLFASSLALTVYMRIEAVLLVISFALLLLAFGENGVWETLLERKKLIIASLDNTRVLLVSLAFLLLILPEVYYIGTQAANPSYGQSGNQSVVSFRNFDPNIGQNTRFLLGALPGMNTIYSYPIVFNQLITPLAIFGALLLLMGGKRKNRFGILLLLGIWFMTYFVFYGAFYAGAATFGVDSRFMLQLVPACVMLASIGIVEIGDRIRGLAEARITRDAKKLDRIFAASEVVLFAAFVAFPFVQLLPVTTIAPSSMPQQDVILPAINAFYSHYSAVPKSCLVFSFTPDIWYEVGVSATQINYLEGANSSMKSSFTRYSCKVFDYGYWCVVPPNKDALCKYLLGRYELKPLASGYTPGGNVTFYQILNYS